MTPQNDRLRVDVLKHLVAAGLLGKAVRDLLADHLALGLRDRLDGQVRHVRGLVLFPGPDVEGKRVAAPVRGPDG